MSEIDSFFKTTLSQFEQLHLIPFANATVYSFIESQNSSNLNITYLSQILCNDKGYFIPNSTHHCQCDFGFFDPYCKSNGLKYWGKGWAGFRIVFGFFYSILSITSWYYYVMKLLGETNCSKTLFRLIIVPKYLIIENLILISNIIDPFGLNGVLSYQSSRVLYELIYGSLVAFYFSILVIWIGVYTSFKMDLNPLTKLMKNKRDTQPKWYSCSYQRVKIICIMLLLIVFPIQIFFSYYICDRETLNDRINAIIYLIVFIVLVVIGFTLHYTITLRSTLNKTYRSNAHANQIEVKVLYNYDNEYEGALKGNTAKAIADRDLIDFLDEMYQKNCIELVDTCILDRKMKGNSNSNDHKDDDDVLDSLDIEKEKRYFDDIEVNELLFYSNGIGNGNINKSPTQILLNPNKRDSAREISENEPLQTYTHLDNNINNISSSRAFSKTGVPVRNSKADKSSIELMELTEIDMKNLDLIFYICYFILTSTLLVFVFVTLIGFNIQTNNPTFVISILISQFTFELLGFFAIFYLFVRDIKTQEYENLKSIAEIENFHKRKEEDSGKGLLHFKGVSLTEVWGRFKSYISLHQIDGNDVNNKGDGNDKGDGDRNDNAEHVFE